MANDKSFKIKNGLLASRYYGSNGTETAGANGPYGVFDTTLYTGNASSQTITNNIDLSTDGGMVWFKSRTNTYNHVIFDTERWTSSNGAGLFTNSTNGAGNINELTSFNTDGFSVTGSGYINDTNDMVAWTFKQASNFFDVVTYTGNGTTDRQIAHNLGISPACIIVKTTSTTGNWDTYHKDLTVSSFAGNNYAYSLALNSTAAEAETVSFRDSTQQTSSVFTLGYTGANTNESGKEYVAYLFGHDTSEDGYIQCGSYTGNSSATGPEIDLGWQPSWIMIKRASGGTGGWFIFDTQRGIVTSGNDATLQAESSAAEGTGDDRIELTSNGFKIVTTSSFFNNTGDTYIYMAIRAVVPTQTLDLSTGHTFSITPTEALDILFSNPPASGTATGFSVEVNNTGGYALTWPSSVKWDLGTAPTATASKEVYTFITTDGGTTYYGKKAAGDIA